MISLCVIALRGGSWRMHGIELFKISLVYWRSFENLKNLGGCRGGHKSE
jgi:hypothetical protein